MILKFFLGWLGPWLVFANAASADLNIVPGKSIGDVRLGDTAAQLVKKGFVPDTDRMNEAGVNFFSRAPLLVRLENDRAVLIWIENLNEARHHLRYHGKRFPKKLSLPVLMKFLGPCLPIEKGSGGEVVKCADQGIEIVTHFGSQDLGLSVLPTLPKR